MGDIFHEMINGRERGVEVPGIDAPVFHSDMVSLADFIKILNNYDDYEGRCLIQHVFNPNSDEPVMDENEAKIRVYLYGRYVHDAFVLLYQHTLDLRAKLIEAGIDVGDPIPGEEKTQVEE